MHRPDIVCACGKHIETVLRSNLGWIYRCNKCYRDWSIRLKETSNETKNIKEKEKEFTKRSSYQI